MHATRPALAARLAAAVWHPALPLTCSALIPLAVLAHRCGGSFWHSGTGLTLLMAMSAAASIGCLVSAVDVVLAARRARG